MTTVTNSMSVRKVLVTGKILRRRSSGTSAPLLVSGRAADGRGTDDEDALPPCFVCGEAFEACRCEVEREPLSAQDLADMRVDMLYDQLKGK